MRSRKCQRADVLEGSLWLRRAERGWPSVRPEVPRHDGRNYVVAAVVWLRRSLGFGDCVWTALELCCAADPPLLSTREEPFLVSSLLHKTAYPHPVTPPHFLEPMLVCLYLSLASLDVVLWSLESGCVRRVTTISRVVRSACLSVSRIGR
jgi:hypothetical protein